MTVDMQFKDDFSGVLYSKGYYKSDICRVSATGGTRHRIVFPLDLCGTEVIKTGGNFQGNVFYNNTVVVMNEAAWGVLEVNDRAFSVSCLWTGSAAKTVDYGLLVPLMETYQNVDPGVIEVPNCWLRIIPGVDPFGGDARVLQLGETATMVVSIRNQQEVFDIFVSNCYGHDGQGLSKIQLLNEGGCPTNTKFIKPPAYDRSTRPGETHMYAHFKVFKFPDADDVYLQCQCLVCYDRCHRPQCDGSGSPPRVKRQATSEEEEEEEAETPGELEEVKVFQKFKVKIPDDNDIAVKKEVPAAGSAKRNFISGYRPENCVPKEVFIAVLVAIMGILILAITIAVCLYMKLQRVTLICEKQTRHGVPEMIVPTYVLTQLGGDGQCPLTVDYVAQPSLQQRAMESAHAHADKSVICDGVNFSRDDDEEETAVQAQSN
ncbi:PREDICTED: cuticlin-1-like [Priapulus caudatus]|uniref:Cuticlin-1-like n=1 Tax=Priapulus caudatus TaxID=37621 RepID=A0ABM1E468_PRICU|nr:PREDICTED: cuticlin-1-like [Priapulus caudatus]